MSVTQTVFQPEPQVAQTRATVTTTPAAVTQDIAPAVVDAARTEVKAPEQRDATPAAQGTVTQQAVVPAATSETAQPATNASPTDTSIAPKETRPVLPKPETAADIATAIPTSLAAIAAVIEANAAKQAGELITQANAQGANIPAQGLAVTVKIDGTPVIAATATETHACTGANCHCANTAKAQASAANIAENVATPETATTAPTLQTQTQAPISETVSAAPVANNAANTSATPAIQQPAVSEAKPEGLAIASSVPAKTIETPAANEATIAPQPQLANGAAR